MHNAMRLYFRRGESNRKTKSRYKKTTVFRESVDESMTMNKPYWRGRKYDI